MRYYPIYLDMNGRNCLIAGGGSVGARKAQTLISSGAVVTVVSPDTDSQIDALADRGCIRLIRRPYESGDLSGMFMVIAATNNASLNRRIHGDAVKSNILVNAADFPQACDFIVPSVIDRGDLLIAVSTSGKSPALARKIRKELETAFGPEYAVLLRLLGAVRKRLLSESNDPAAHKRIFEKLVYSELPKMIQENQSEEINTLLRDILGQGFDFHDLV